MIRATLVYAFVAAFILVMGPIAVAWALLSKNTRLIYDLARFCIRAAGVMCGVKVRVYGKEKILPGQTYIFLSNHQGNFDAPVLAHAIPRDWRALIKKEVMRLPVLSLVLRQVKMVPIDRSDPQKARSSIDLGVKLLGEGYSFIAFPEGTRSRNGQLGEFKKGVFMMALRARTPIVPISILNSSTIQPPGEYAIRPGIIDVIFHDPIPTDSMAADQRDRLIEMTRSAIASGLEREKSAANFTNSTNAQN
ncbi:MAG TPA: lysophospholipid acyltransferase family protein [Acidobacteriota bacterium]|nr:lysophospholipid acyltransferase family protein [Acidobacteriota bacterium]